jgi:hypothetical protein
MRDMRLTAGIEQIFYNLALEGADEEVGVREHGRWAALLRNTGNLGDRVRDLVDSGEVDLRDEDIDNELWEVLNTAAGAVVTREVDGTVSVEAYDSEEDLAAGWSARAMDMEEVPGNPRGVVFEDEELEEDAGWDIGDAEKEGRQT